MKDRRTQGTHETVQRKSASHTVPGKRTLTQMLPENSSDERVRAHTESIQDVAAVGVAGAASPLPFAGTIQNAFGRHDVSQVRAAIGGAGGEAAKEIGASAYATGDRVAFAGTPDLHTAAHEAAHVVQQRTGVALKGGVGEAGDPFEQHADHVADLVVAGRSAESALDARSHSSGVGDPVQRQTTPAPAPTTGPAPAAAAPTPMPGPRAGLTILVELDAIHTAMLAQGHPSRIGSGFRTIDQQIQTYAKGRTLADFTTAINAAVAAGTVTQAKATQWIAYYTPIPAAAPTAAPGASSAPTSAPSVPSAATAPAGPAAAAPAPGGHPMPPGEPGPVTWTFTSRHLTGDAADIVHETLGWGASAAFWTALNAAAVAQGLQIGPPTTDVAHVQRP